MPTPNPRDQERSDVYVLARALCKKGVVNNSRKKRLTLALLELRDRIMGEFLQVAKDWQVSAQQLRHNYWRAYPFPNLGAPDVICLEHACEAVMVSLHYEILRSAKEYGVPDDLVQAMLLDWMASDAEGRDRTPSALFIPKAKKWEREVPDDRLPRLKDLLVARPQRGASSGKLKKVRTAERVTPLSEQAQVQAAEGGQGGGEEPGELEL